MSETKLDSYNIKLDGSSKTKIELVAQKCSADNIEWGYLIDCYIYLKKLKKQIKMEDIVNHSSDPVNGLTLFNSIDEAKKWIANNRQLIDARIIDFISLHS